MRFIGIDPGLRGVIAVLDSRGQPIDIEPTPLEPLKNGRDDFDLHEIRAVLQRHAIEERGQIFVTVEKSRPLPPRFKTAAGEMRGGSAANFGRGVARGWVWMLVGMGLSRDEYRLTYPQEWQRKMLEGVKGGTTKARAIAAARMLWPDQSLQRTARSRTDSPDIADALLIAEWGRRQRLGGEMFARAAGAQA